MKKLSLSILFLVLAAGAFWYMKHQGHKAYTVEEVLSQASALNGQRVCVRGTVRKPFSALVAGYFRLEGASGTSLHVITNGAVPQPETKTTVCGTFREAYRLGALSLPVIIVP